jgi:hypothetical protein
MTTVLTFAVVIAVFILAAVFYKLVNQVEEMRRTLSKMESDRMETKLNNIFAHVLRELAREKVVVTHYRASFASIGITREGNSPTLYVRVNTNLATYQTGQLNVYASSFCDIYSCEEDLRNLVKQIRKVFHDITVKEQAS